MRVTFQCRLNVGCRCLTQFSTGTIVVFCEKDVKFMSWLSAELTIEIYGVGVAKVC